MGLLYDLIDRSISEDEIALCYKEMRLIWERLEYLLPDKILKGISVCILSDTSYTLSISMADNPIIMEVLYNKCNGTLRVTEGTSIYSSETENIIFCKDLKGRFYNTINIIGSIKHKQKTIILKKGSSYNAYIYGSNLIMTAPEIIDCKLSKLVVKNVLKSSDWFKVSL